MQMNGINLFSHIRPTQKQSFKANLAECRVLWANYSSCCIDDGHKFTSAPIVGEDQFEKGPEINTFVQVGSFAILRMNGGKEYKIVRYDNLEADTFCRNRFGKMNFSENTPADTMRKGWFRENEIVKTRTYLTNSYWKDKNQIRLDDGKKEAKNIEDIGIKLEGSNKTEIFTEESFNEWAERTNLPESERVGVLKELDKTKKLFALIEDRDKLLKEIQEDINKKIKKSVEIHKYVKLNYMMTAPGNIKLKPRVENFPPLEFVLTNKEDMAKAVEIEPKNEQILTDLKEKVDKELALKKNIEKYCDYTLQIKEMGYVNPPLELALIEYYG